MVKSMQPPKTEVPHLHKNAHNMNESMQSDMNSWYVLSHQLILENEMN